MICLGILGGIGPESTVDYYKRFIDGLREPGSMRVPEMLVHSLDLGQMTAFVDASDWAGLTGLLVSRLEGLHKAGADLAIIASNTPHIVFHEVSAASPLPLVSIVEATLHTAKARGLRKIGLLGTALTMASGYYARTFSPAGIELVTPNEQEQHYIHDKLMSEIELGQFHDETRQGLLRIIERLVDEHGVEAVILGCTELPLILTDGQGPVPFLNTTAIHVEHTIAVMREKEGAMNLFSSSRSG